MRSCGVGVTEHAREALETRAGELGQVGSKRAPWYRSEAAHIDLSLSSSLEWSTWMESSPQARLCYMAHGDARMETPPVTPRPVCTLRTTSASARAMNCSLLRCRVSRRKSSSVTLPLSSASSRQSMVSSSA